MLTASTKPDNNLRTGQTPVRRRPAGKYPPQKPNRNVWSRPQIRLVEIEWVSSWCYKTTGLLRFFFLETETRNPVAFQENWGRKWMGREGGGGIGRRRVRDLRTWSCWVLHYWPTTVLTARLRRRWTQHPPKKKRNNFSSLFCLWLGWMKTRLNIKKKKCSIARVVVSSLLRQAAENLI